MCLVPCDPGTGFPAKIPSISNMRDSCLPRSTVLLGAVSLLLAAAPDIARPAPIPVNVTTYHNDAARTGQYLYETQLTPATVSASTFGKRFASVVDGQVYAQPLYLAGLAMKSQGRHNVVFVVTEHDSVYAFDADTGATLWHTSFLVPTTPETSVTTVPYTDLPGQCQQITPELGITATPALDPTAGTLYVVAMTKEATTINPTAAPAVNYFQRLHALDITTGAERSNSPVDIEAVVTGTGDGGAQDIFVPLDYKERPGLVLSGGLVYTFWSSHCDVEPYQGWVMSYDATSLVQKSVYNVTANGQEASFWDGGAAPGLDAAGNLYLGAGNGTFDLQNDDGTLHPGGVDIGESFLRLSTTGGLLAAADWFTPYNKDYLNDHDLDTGSAGVVLYDVGNNHLMTSAGKEGRIYVLNRDNLGHYTPGADTGAFQTVPPGAAGITGGLFGCPAFFNSATNGPTLYFSAIGDSPKAFVLDAAGRLPAGPTSQVTTTFGYPGAVPSISANAGANGIAWMLQDTAVLHAYDADNLATELYNSGENATRDALGSYVKFTTPIITQGRVYVGTNDHLVAYGLLSPAVATDLTSQFTVTAGAVRPSINGNHLVQDVTLTYTGSASLNGPVSLVLDGLNRAASLYNADGTTTQAAPLASFYKTAVLSAGSATVRLRFDNAKNTRIVWTPRVLGGTGAR